MNKRLVIALTGLILMTNFAFAETEVKVVVDGNPVVYKDQAAVIENGRTLVPLRATFNALGAEVDWMAETSTVFANKRLKSISLKIDDTKMYVDGKETTLEVPAKLINGRTMIPLRAVAEALDTKVGWDAESFTVNIESKQGNVKVTDKIVSEIVKDEATGKELLEISYAYPQFEEKIELLANLNKEYSEAADSYIENGKVEALESAKEFLEFGAEILPFESKHYFDITYNKNNRLSILESTAIYLGGAHPNSIWEAKNYDIIIGQELELVDIFPDKTQEEINNEIIAKFEQVIENGEKLYNEEIMNAIKENIDNINFYLTEEGVECYFQQYEVAPYALGMPSIILEY